MNTTKDAAKAVAIPGHQDTQLAKVEDELYHELCDQHARAGLFVTAKADEINRRLRMRARPNLMCAPLSPLHDILSLHVRMDTRVLTLMVLLQSIFLTRSAGSYNDAQTPIPTAYLGSASAGL